MKQIGKIVVQSGLAMPVAQPLAQCQCSRSGGNGPRMIAAGAAGQGQVVQRRDVHDEIIQCFGALQAQLQVTNSLVEIAVVAGQDAQDVVRLGKAAPIAAVSATAKADRASPAARATWPC